MDTLAKLAQELLDQFPPFPTHEATWNPIYMEPVMCSGERIAIAVIAFDSDGCEALKTLSPARLLGLFGTQATGMANMIDLVIEAALRHGNEGNLDNFRAPLSGITLGESRSGLGENRRDVLQQAASLTSCFYESDQDDVEKQRIDWLKRQLAEIDGFIERDRARLSESPEKLSIQLSLDSWLKHHIELSDELSAVLAGK